MKKIIEYSNDYDFFLQHQVSVTRTINEGILISPRLESKRLYTFLPNEKPTAEEISSKLHEIHSDPEKFNLKLGNYGDSDKTPNLPADL